MPLTAMIRQQHFSALLSLLDKDTGSVRHPGRQGLNADLPNASGAVDASHQKGDPHQNAALLLHHPSSDSFLHASTPMPISPISPPLPTASQFSTGPPASAGGFVAPKDEQGAEEFSPKIMNDSFMLPVSVHPPDLLDMSGTGNSGPPAFGRAGADPLYMQRATTTGQAYLSVASNALPGPTPFSVTGPSYTSEPLTPSVPQALLNGYFGQQEAGIAPEEARITPESSAGAASRETEAETVVSSDIYKGSHGEGRTESNSSSSTGQMIGVVHRGLPGIDSNQQTQPQARITARPLIRRKRQYAASCEPDMGCIAPPRRAPPPPQLLSPKSTSVDPANASSPTSIALVSDCVGTHVATQMPTTHCPAPPRRATRGRGGRAGIPSKFCHVCTARTADGAAAVCAGVPRGTCRKTVCRSCFIRYEEVFVWEGVAGRAGHAWDCFHCRSRCPAAAQCKSYERVNEKRRQRLLKLKLTSGGVGGGGEQGDGNDVAAVHEMVDVSGAGGMHSATSADAQHLLLDAKPGIYSSMGQSDINNV